MKDTIYFAHPIKFYHTEQETKILQHIKNEYPKARIINPADMRVQQKRTNCADCMQKTMKPIFFKQIDRCSIFVIWNPIDSCGIRCELHYAWINGKKIKHISIQVHLRDIELQDYHYSHKEE